MDPRKRTTPVVGNALTSGEPLAIKVGDPYPSTYSEQPHGLSIVLAIEPYEGPCPNHFTHVLRLSAPRMNGSMRHPVHEKHFQSRFFVTINESRKNEVAQYERDQQAQRSARLPSRVPRTIDLFDGGSDDLFGQEEDEVTAPGPRG